MTTQLQQQDLYDRIKQVIIINQEPQKMRVFFAITLEESAKKTLSEFIIFQKRNSAFENMWWTKPENLHITLRFLAHIEEEKLSQLTQAIDSKIKNENVQPFFLNTKEIILFSTSHAKILSLNIESNEEILKLVKLINTETELIGFEKEKRSFLPHLTLGRIKNTLLIPLPDLSLPTLQLPINKIILFESKPTQEGSHYIQRHIFTLKHS